jgi:hypothetical protein
MQNVAEHSKIIIEGWSQKINLLNFVNRNFGVIFALRNGGCSSAG